MTTKKQNSLNRNNKTGQYDKNTSNGKYSTFDMNQNAPLLAIILCSIATRFYNIHEPAHVCWDETHFGKMASWYLNRTFFFDVHPPLGKMLIALSGHMTGYEGDFAFDKPGDDYQHWTQYVGMRIFCALLGFSIPTIVYRVTESMTSSKFAAFMAASLIVFDNGMITLTRYILLDPPLLFFISFSFLSMTEISFKRNPLDYTQAFTVSWWFWMVATGVSIACAFSVKFVGLFIVALVGLRTLYDIWLIFGDTSKPLTYFTKHLMARVACLIVIPICIYISIFYIHLRQLSHSGNGDGFYSSSFQSQLIGNSLHNSSWPAHLAYNAQITIKNNRIGGAYLHSHWHLYPEGVGARQQQVTTYSHKDSNNKWIIKRANIGQHPNDEFVRDGDLVILEHLVTQRNLHSHYEIAPITKRQYQVTCYGENGVGDANDFWRIQKELSGLSSQEEDDRIYTVKTRFKLVHYISNCALHSHSRQLPKWAFEQLEVTCNPKLHDKNNFWNIEDNFYPSLPNISFETYAPSFMDRFIESHAVMLQGNAGLKPKEGEVTSRPWQWPLNYRGQFFSATKGHKIYLLGNPIIWWANIIALPVSITIAIIVLISQQLSNQSTPTQPHKSKPPIIDNFIEASSWNILGWTLHYAPFYFMGRVLYFHHYFPAFIFSSIQTAITFDYILSFLGYKFKIQTITRRKIDCLIVTTALILYAFIKFIPLTYGIRPDSYGLEGNDKAVEMARSEQHLASLKWLDSWEF